jgi:hypothetical protein
MAAFFVWSISWTIFGSNRSLWSIGDIYVSGMGSPLTIFFSIVRLLVLYGMLFSVALSCLGLRLDK